MLIVGGENLEVPGNGEDEVAQVEIYNPATGTFTFGPFLIVARSSHTATMLNNGKILIAGGYRANGSCTDRTEILDPATNRSTEGPLLNDFHVRATATKLLNGEVLIFAGGNGGGPSIVVEKFR